MRLDYTQINKRICERLKVDPVQVKEGSLVIETYTDVGKAVVRWDGYAEIDMNVLQDILNASMVP